MTCVRVFWRGEHFVVWRVCRQRAVVGIARVRLSVELVLLDQHRLAALQLRFHAQTVVGKRSAKIKSLKSCPSTENEILDRSSLVADDSNRFEMQQLLKT